MAIQTRSLFYISLIDENGVELFFQYDSNQKTRALNFSSDFNNALISGETYIKGRINRIMKNGIFPDFSFNVKVVNPNSIKIHEIKFSHGAE